MQKPLPLPLEIQEILSRDPLILDFQADLADPTGDHPQEVKPWADYLVASEIDLNQDPFPDFLVQPAKSASYLYGASTCPFWIFEQKAEGRFTCVLTTRSAFINLAKTKTRGFRNIETNWFTGTGTMGATFVYDGTSYRLQHRGKDGYSRKH